MIPLLKVYYDWDWFEEACKSIATQVRGSFSPKNVYGVPRGGLVLAVRLSHLLDVPIVTDVAYITDDTLVVDDVCDSGNTLACLLIGARCSPRVAVLSLGVESKFPPNYWYSLKPVNYWSVYPWESEVDTVSKVTERAKNEN